WARSTACEPGVSGGTTSAGGWVGSGCSASTANMATEAATASPATGRSCDSQRSMRTSLGTACAGSLSSAALTRAARSTFSVRPRRASPSKAYCAKRSRSSGSRRIRSSSSSACSGGSSSSSSNETCSSSLSFMPSVLVEQRPQPVADRFSGPEYPGAHRADGTIHRHGNFLVTQAFQLAQHDRGAQFLRKAFYRRLHRCLDLVGQQHAFRRVHAAEACIHLVLFRVLQVHLLVNRTPALRHGEILGGIDGDSVEPGVERTFAAEVGQRTIRLDEALLRNVQGFRRFVHVAGNQLDDLVLVLLHQQIEGRLVATLHALHEQLVGITAHCPLRLSTWW